VRVGFLLEQCLAPVPGGTGRYSRELARALVETAEPGDSVTGWVAAHRDVRPAAVPGVDGPHRLPLGRRALAVAWERGAGPVPHGVGAVHAPTLLVPPRRSVPLVVTIHDLVPWTHPATLTPRGVAFHRRMGGRAARVADVVLTDTAAVAAELPSVLGIDADRVRVVPLGVTDWPGPDGDPEVRSRLGLPAEYAVTLATLEPRKGLDVALAALARPEACGLPLVVAGPPGWGGVDVAAEAQRAGLPPQRVVALGRCTDAELAAVVRGALLLVQPSRAEGFGLPVVEAQAVGVPCVVTDVPALVEVAGGAALVVPTEDPDALAAAIGRLAGDTGLRSQLAAAGRTNAARYTWRRSAELTWRAYRAALGASH
jgi:glycosyltransferase involved in cell wall biosynthesis